ncbi:MAG: IS5 family transposase [Legionellaceae bacterium]|nr:IS5 family transposase [Legionellaceae bacterium]
MPNKYPSKKGWDVPKQKYKVKNWPEYNAALKSRGDITVWISNDVISQWYEKDRIYDGTGTPQYYTDLAIIICHEIRQVYRLALRQTEGFINSLFSLMNIPLFCPSYSTLSTRLSALNILSPRYTKKDNPDSNVHAIAIDSTGLKRFGRGEWHEQKYKLSNRASWRKLHMAVNEEHYIEGCALTDRFSHDARQVTPLLEQITTHIDHFTADGAYDKTPVYHAVTDHSPDADVVIPPQSDAILSANAASLRNRNIEEIKNNGRMNWQKTRNYGQRNTSELAMFRYQKILSDSLHARELSRQKQEAMIGCGVINKMTSLGMPVTCRVA